MLRPAVFLDRDGVILENRPDYVKSLAEAHLLPGALEALRRLARLGWPVLIVTNQSAIGRGLVTLEQVCAINDRLVRQVAVRGGKIDAVYLCPHLPEEGCACRKPAPGMLLQAARHLDLDLGRSLLVGDALSDLQAARAVGAKGLLVLSGRGAEQAAGLAAAGFTDCPVLADLAAAVDYILEREGAWPEAAQPVAQPDRQHPPQPQPTGVQLLAAEDARR